jgi:hypothetical protein
LHENRNLTLLIQIGKWIFWVVGTIAALFSFVAWLLVPGTVDLNRLIVAGLFASLATNGFLLSEILFGEREERGSQTIRSVLKTPQSSYQDYSSLCFS